MACNAKLHVLGGGMPSHICISTQSLVQGTFMKRDLDADEFVGPDDLLIRTGDDLVKARLGKVRTKQLVSKMRSVLHD